MCHILLDLPYLSLGPPASSEFIIPWKFGKLHLMFFSVQQQKIKNLHLTGWFKSFVTLNFIAKRKQILHQISVISDTKPTFDFQVSYLLQSAWAFLNTSSSKAQLFEW